MIRSTFPLARISCVFVLLAAVTVACSSSDSDGSTSPTQTNLSGKWTGTIATSGDPNPATLVWTAAQSGSTLSGPVTATIVDAGQSRSFTGTLSGTTSASAITLTLSFPAGTFTALGGPSTCAMSGTSNATLAATKIAGTL